MTVAEAFETIVSACVRHFRSNEALVIEHRSIEGLHQLRVAMRRLRAAFSLFRPAIAGPAFEHVEVEVDWFTRELGEARNFDVYLQRDLAAEVRRIFEAEREEAYGTVVAALKSLRFKQMMSALEEWVSDGEWRAQRRASQPVTRFVDKRIDRMWKRFSRSRRLRSLGAKRRHRLRIRDKKLRYALEFTRGLHPHRKRRRKFGKTIERLQDELGQINDLVMAQRLAIDPDAQDVQRQSKEIREHLRRAVKAQRRLRKIGPYWRH